MPYYSLHELDKKIEPFVDFDNGVFFEAGANNGVTFSNTAHFEFDRNWTGVLVEPIPTRIAEARKSRPKSKCFHAALVPEGYPAKEITLTYCNMMTVTRDPDRLWDGDEHVQRGVTFLRKRREVPHDFTAPARTISSILDECGISKIDLMSLDIEGFEHQAFRGLDLDRHHVRFICVEAKGVGVLDRVLESLRGRFSMVKKLASHDFLLKCDS